MPYQHTNFYSIPLLYDILHQPGTAEELDVLLRLHRRYGASSTKPIVLEPACGTGRLLRLAAMRGHRAVGFDAEAGMVEFARERAGASLSGRLRYAQARMEDFDRAWPSGWPRTGPWSRVDLAINPINTIRHLTSDRAMLAHLASVARVLRPRGIYIVGISLSAYGLESETEDVWEGARGRLRVKQVVQYIPPESRSRDERVISHLVVSRPRGEEHIDSSYVLRTYDLEQWTRLIDRSPMRVLAVTGDDGKEIRPPKIGYALWVLAAR